MLRAIIEIMVRRDYMIPTTISLMALTLLFRIYCSRPHTSGAEKEGVYFTHYSISDSLITRNSVVLKGN